MTADGPRGRQGFRPLSRCRWRRHPVPHLSGHASDQGRVLHPRHHPRPLRALLRGRRATTSTTWSGCCASSRPPKSSCRSRCCADADKPTKIRRDLFRLDLAGDGRGDRACSRPRHPLDAMRVRAFPFHDERRRLHRRRTTRCSWSSRTATRRCARCIVNEFGIDPARLVPVLHYDGTPITARFIAGEIADGARRAQGHAAAQGGRHDLYRQAQVSPSGAAEERARLHASRLRGLGLDAVRGLRPRFDLAPPSSRPASSSTSRRTGSPSSPASAAPPRRRPISWATRTASTRVHGRMPSVLTGANLANRDLIYLGVSGDGDSASIGFGQFAHSLRRGVNMVYIVENNGVYGLTKGQFSATADRGSKSQAGRRSTPTTRSTWSAWRCSSAPPTSRAASRATRRSSCR